MFFCRRVTELASAAMDRELSLRERFSFRGHLLNCRWCRRYLRQLWLLRRLLRDHFGMKLPFTLSAEARRRIERVLGS
jgi:hypothetical protein